MDPGALQALRGELPVWIGLAPLLIWAPAAWLLGRWTTALAGRVAIGPWRRLTHDAHWTDRARLAWPVRLVTAFCALLVPALLGVLAVRAGGELALLPHAVLVPVVATCAWLGSATARLRAGRELGVGAQRLGDLARDDAVQLALLAPHTLLPLAFAPFVRVPFDVWDAGVIAALTLLFVALACGGMLHVLRWVGWTEPVPEKLRSAVAAAARALQLPAPPLTVIRWGVANAFAFPIRPQLAFSSACAERLDAAELEAVTAHEIGHLTEPLAVRSLRAAVFFAMLPLVGVVAAFQLGGPVGALLPVLGMLLLALAFRAVAARMEKRADAVAHSAGSPQQYAAALARIYEVNGVPAVMSGRQVHPHLYDRMTAAGVTPDYPRPPSPSAWRIRMALLAAIVWLAPAATALAGLPILLTVPALHDRSASDLVIALEPGADPLFRRAMLEESQGRSDDVLRFARAARELDPLRHDAAALEATVLGRQGRCDEAEALIDASEALARDGAEDAWVLTARHWLDWCRTNAARTASVR
jgi:Zn-dependent protease with chaperone function